MREGGCEEGRAACARSAKGYILAEAGRGGRPANELDWTRISCTWGVAFVTEISEIAISNYLKLLVWIAISKFKFSLQPNYSQWGDN